MNAAAPTRSLAAVVDRPLVRVLLYYVVLFAGLAAITRLVPGSMALLNAPTPVTEFLPDALPGGGAGAPPAASAADPASVVLVTLLALASACILMIPVTWVYTQTGARRGSSSPSCRR